MPRLPAALLGVDSRFLNNDGRILPGGETNGLEVHQSLLVARILEKRIQEEHSCPTEYWDMDVLEAKLGNSQDFRRAVPFNTLFLFCWARDPQVKQLQSLMRRITGQARDSRRFVHFYPDFREVQMSEGKIYDIKELDRIAASAPHGFAFRPATCFQYGKCTVGERADVVKRSHSSCSAQVYLTPDETVRTRLLCRSAYPALSSTCRDPIDPVWFHQQKVQSLIDHGEFRILIVDQVGDGPLESCKASIVATFLTKPDEDRLIILRLDEGYQLDHHFCGGRTLRDLHDFALYYFMRLRTHWCKSQFASLSVGVRLDIGISSQEDGHRFFVNEITREWAADYFSHYATPITKICSEIAEARYRHFFYNRQKKITS